MPRHPDYLKPFVPADPRLVELAREFALAQMPSDDDFKAFVSLPDEQRMMEALRLIGPVHNCGARVEELTNKTLAEFQAERAAAVADLTSENVGYCIAEVFSNYLNMAAVCVPADGYLLATQRGLNPGAVPSVLYYFSGLFDQTTDAECMVDLVHGEFNRLAGVRDLHLPQGRLELSGDGELKLYKREVHEPALLERQGWKKAVPL